MILYTSISRIIKLPPTAQKCPSIFWLWIWSSCFTVQLLSSPIRWACELLTRSEHPMAWKRESFSATKAVTVRFEATEKRILGVFHLVFVLRKGLVIKKSSASRRNVKSEYVCVCNLSRGEDKQLQLSIFVVCIFCILGLCRGSKIQELDKTLIRLQCTLTLSTKCFRHVLS